MSEGLGVMTRWGDYWIPTGFVLLIAAGVLLTAWQAGKTNGQAKHCERDLGGVAVKRIPSGDVVCVRTDGVLKAYR